MVKKQQENIKAGDKSPGPAAYYVKPTIGKDATDPSIETNPKYSILGRECIRERNFGPGPAAYDTTGLTENGRHRTPGGLISGRLGGRAVAVMPGPADYCVPSTMSPIGHRMRPDASRQSDRWSGPAPNAYSLPDTLNTRSASLGHRLADRTVCPTPGPGHYILPSTDLYLPGTFNRGRSIGRRLKGKRTDDCMPGPADYDGGARVNCCARPRGAGHDCGSQPCRTTFGVRWPDSVRPYLVPQDNPTDLHC